MNQNTSTKKYDLEDRTLKFAKQVIELVNVLPSNLSNNEIAKQLIRSAGSVGANYIEANGALSKKDFVLRVRISRKETRESKFWLSLLTIKEQSSDERRMALIQETEELSKIFGTIIDKVQPKV
jgi:four helix bundle protein